MSNVYDSVESLLKNEPLGDKTGVYRVTTFHHSADGNEVENSEYVVAKSPGQAALASSKVERLSRAELLKHFRAVFGKKTNPQPTLPFGGSEA